jgi:RHS repeat-associated protein
MGCICSDRNGNRANTGYSTGTNNRLTSDGVFNYTYDAEGNRLTRTRISTEPANDYLTEYTWDHHNRLTSVTHKDNSGAVTMTISWTYDVFGRRVTATFDSDGAGPAVAIIARWVYDGPNPILVFDGNGGLYHRYLHAGGLGTILADEQYLSGPPSQTPLVPGTVLFGLADNLGTIRDVVDVLGNVLNHLKYDSFGRITSETNPATEFAFAFTGLERDESTGLYRAYFRYYDPAVGRWISEDPIGFAAGDTNLARYVGNGPTNASDPLGLVEQQLRYGRWAGEPYKSDFILDKPIKDASGHLRKRVPFVDGLPDFSDWAKGHVDIILTGDNDIDQRVAREHYKKKFGRELPKDFTFHHDGLNVCYEKVDGKTVLKGRMQAVPLELNKAIGHEGSASFARQLMKRLGYSTDEVKRLAAARNARLLEKATRTTLKEARLAKPLGRRLRIIPVVGTVIAIIFFADDADAHGFDGAALRATPLLGDLMLLVDARKPDPRDVAAAKRRADARMEEHARYVALRDTLFWYQWLARELRVDPSKLDFEKVAQAARAYHDRRYAELMKFYRDFPKNPQDAIAYQVDFVTRISQDSIIQFGQDLKDIAGDGER